MVNSLPDPFLQALRPGLLAIALLLAATADATRAEPREPAAQDGVLTVGSISVSIEDEVGDFRPLVDYLAGRLSDHGIRRGRVSVATDLAGLERRAREERIDLYIDSPFPVAVMQQRVGFRPVLRRWKKGVAEYHSVVIVRSDSPVTRLADLRGRMIAFDEPSSTSGYLLPKATLAQAGIVLKEYAAATDPVASGEAGYVFSGDDENTLLWVLKQRVGAGALDDKGFAELTRKQASRFRVLARSVDVPRHVVALGPAVEPALATAIESVLLGMNRDPEGRAVLREFQKTTRFDRFPAGPEAGMGEVLRLMSLVEGELR